MARSWLDRFKDGFPLMMETSHPLGSQPELWEGAADPLPPMSEEESLALLARLEALPREDA